MSSMASDKRTVDGATVLLDGEFAAAAARISWAHDEALRELATLRAELTDLAARESALRVVLKELEWSASDDGDRCCPVCDRYDPSGRTANVQYYQGRHGHKDGCSLAAALATPATGAGEVLRAAVALWQFEQDRAEYLSKPRNMDETEEHAIKFDERIEAVVAAAAALPASVREALKGER